MIKKYIDLEIIGQYFSNIHLQVFLTIFVPNIFGYMKEFFDLHIPICLYKSLLNYLNII